MRNARKAIGLAPSPDVARLAKMISTLRAQVEELTGTRVIWACVSTLHLVALYHEDLYDAFKYADLIYIGISPRGSPVLYETSAAYAGYGNGLCSNYKDQRACEQEEMDMPMETVMSVLYTQNILGFALSSTQSALHLIEEDFVPDFTLGYDARVSRGPDEERYWNLVGSGLEYLMLRNEYRPADKVLLMGDCIGNETFQRVLKKSLRLEETETPKVFSEGSEGVAAKGAAEFAKRLSYWDQPPGCQPFSKWSSRGLDEL